MLIAEVSEFIKCMRGVGLPVEILIEYVGLFQQGDETMDARKELLIKQQIGKPSPGIECCSPPMRPAQVLNDI